MDFSDDQHSLAELVFQGATEIESMQQVGDEANNALMAWRQRSDLKLSGAELLQMPNCTAFSITYEGEASDYWPNEPANEMTEVLIREFLYRDGICSLSDSRVLSAPFPLRFLFASQPKIMGKALGIVYRTIATHLTHKAGYTRSTAHTGAVTLIQRFGSALNLNIHFHMLFLDGVYTEYTDDARLPKFRWVKAPTSSELNHLAHTIAHRLARYLERQGLLERDAEHSYLTLENSEEDPMDQLRGHSITYRIAVGPGQGRKVFALQTLPDERDADETPVAGNVAGFSLHAGVAAKANQRDKLERLCRYITRPAISEKRLSLTKQGKVRYELKTPYRDGTSHVIFEPVDFIAKLAALVPKPRVNLT